MAALDTPLMTTLSPNTDGGPSSTTSNPSAPPPTYAAFSPNSSSRTSAHNTRTTILVHQKSPLLIATPPQITRALAYSYPFISPLSKLAGLLSWSTSDPWESFLLVVAFWATVLYGDFVIRTMGPLLLGAGLILGMYTRRFSPLSSTGWATSQPTTPTSNASDSHGTKPQKRPRKATQGSAHHKSLDEIVAALQTFTTRCNILLDPFLTLTDFLSTQHTATTATTRPALTALFIRLLMLAPIWLALSLSPLRLVTTKRVILAVGTTALSWHSRPARVSRVILWRSKTVRRAASIITGLSFSTPGSGSSARDADKTAVAATKLAATDKRKEGIRFTFALYENQRRWLGIGWTHSMLAYERAPWTDEYLNPSPSKDAFNLPEVAGGLARWRWCEGSDWEIEDDSTKGERDAAARKRATSEGKSNIGDTTNDSEVDEDKGWIYYDNKWQNGRRGVDGWGRYTRRRKWVRDAELVEITPSMDTTPVPSPRLDASPSLDDKTALPKLDDGGGLLKPEHAANGGTNYVSMPTTPTKGHKAASSLDSNSSHGGGLLGSSPETDGPKERISWFRRRRGRHSRSRSQTPSIASTTGAASTTSLPPESEDSASEVTRTTDRDDDDGYVPMRSAPWERAWNINIGDDVAMGMG